MSAFPPRRPGMTRGFPEMARTRCLVRAVAAASLLPVLAAFAIGVVHRPRPAPPGVFDAPGERILSGGVFRRTDGASFTLDLASGRIGPTTIAGVGRLELASISPWRHCEGRRDLVGRHLVDRGGNLVVSLSCLEYPSGRHRDEIPLAVTNLSAPSWDPARRGSFVFVGFDGEFYRVDLGSEPGRGSVAKIRRGDGLFPGEVLLPVDACFAGPAGPARILLATMSGQHPDPTARRRLWWLRLDPAGGKVEAAGPMFPPGRTAWTSEGCPAIGEGPTLAFLAKSRPGRVADLRTVPLRVDPQTGSPTADPSEAELVATNCEPWTPAFSPDGRWVYSIRDDAGSPQVARHELRRSVSVAEVSAAVVGSRLAFDISR